MTRGPASPFRLRSPAARILLLFCCLMAVRPDFISAYDCFDPNNREVTQRVRRGELTTICLYVGPGEDWNGSDISYTRFSVNLVADEFSSYEVPKSFTAVADSANPLFGSNATHIFAASQSSLSFLRRYYDRTSNRIYPYLTAIIDVKDGVVRGIAWDDACIFCEMSECPANTYNFDGSVATAEQIGQPVNGCYLNYAQCAGFRMDGSHQCDLKLFVVWTGTDVNGDVLLSSDTRFSMFPPNRIQEGVQGRYDKMVQSLNNMKDKIPGLG